MPTEKIVGTKLIITPETKEYEKADIVTRLNQMTNNRDNEVAESELAILQINEYYQPKIDELQR